MDHSLVYPRHLAGRLPFVCELCTVRANFGANLPQFHQGVKYLLALERMRLIDLAYTVSPNSIKTYAAGWNHFQSYWDSRNLPNYFSFLPSHPPIGRAIHLSYCLLEHGITPSTHARGPTPEYGSTRGIATAVGGFHTLAVSLFGGDDIYRNQNRLLSSPVLAPSGCILATSQLNGMGSRMGKISRKTEILLHRHYVWLQRYRGTQLRSELPLWRMYLLICGQCIEFCGFLGGLRSEECFSLTRRDILLVKPDHGDPGYIGLKLLPATKGSQSSRVDVVIAWRTAGLLNVGVWFSLLFSALDTLGYLHETDFLFRSSASVVMNTTTYRRHLLFPLLYEKLRLGDSHLEEVLLGHDEGTIESAFFSFHLHRRSGATHVKLAPRPSDPWRRPRASEVDEHNRWLAEVSKQKDDSQAMRVRYSRPPKSERARFTAECF